MSSNLASDLIIGADEVGLGPLAGPLVVCAVCASEARSKLWRIKDSKKFRKHSHLKTAVRYAGPVLHSVVSISADEIIRIGYTAALDKAFQLAVGAVRYQLRPRVPRAVIDGIHNHFVPHSRTYIGGDRLVPVVSLASCIAKIAQVRYMEDLHAKYPEYGFLKNHGYGTHAHLAALKQHGALPHIHRIPVIAKMAGMQNLKIRRVA
jgi:ribonuclease HII